MGALLHTLLKAHLIAALSSVRLAGQARVGEQVGPPRVYIGGLPPKRRPQGEDDPREVPCVVIVPHRGRLEIDSGGAITEESVGLICVVYNSGDDAVDGDFEGVEADLANLVSAVIGALLPCAEGRPLARRFVLVPDDQGKMLAWAKAEEQPRPFLQATIVSTWNFKGWE